MTWTDDMPTVPGWYWYRDERPESARIYEICVTDLYPLCLYNRDQPWEIGE